jgi:hypothetical protein
VAKVVVMKSRYLLVVGVVLLSLNSCKKNSAPSPQPVSIVGKWFYARQATELYNGGTEINTINKTNFTTDDFVEYYSNGTGYYSQSTALGPSLSQFTYTLKGTALTEYTSAADGGLPETITTLSADSLLIHAVILVPDPNDPSVNDTEVDDYTFTR